MNQCNCLSKEDTTSPTVSNEVLILSCILDAMEMRGVATTDIPGAFLQTDYYKVDIYIKMWEAMVTLLDEIEMY